ncbi:hypothetical protein MKW92_034926, partial [Papaver armeniacum]
MKRFHNLFTKSNKKARRENSPAFGRKSKFAEVGTKEASVIEVDSSHSGHKGRRKSISGVFKQGIKGLNAHSTLREDKFTKEQISLSSSNERIVPSSPEKNESGDIIDEGPSNDSLEVMSGDETPIKERSPQFRSSVIGENAGYSEDSSSDKNPRELRRENMVIVQTIFLNGGKLGKRNRSESSLTFFSQWLPSVDTALIKIFVSPITEIKLDDRNDDPGHLDLQFLVLDARWLETLEKIYSLDARYRGLWKLVLDNTWEVSSSGENSSSYATRHSPNVDEQFEDIIYPRSDPDAVTITKREIEMLQPMRFINGTIIDFYIKYLKNKIPPEDGHRFHFFNNFFYQKLTACDQDLPSAYQGREAFLRVRKWTRKVNPFEKDYIFIPINFAHHWSLIIICHPGEAAKSKGEDVENFGRIPCILHMNSIEGSHKGIKQHIQSYLWEEWKERNAGASDDYLSKFLDLRFVDLEVPQQKNFYDCGLFLLHYVECFLEEAPVNFSPFNLLKDSTFLNVDWFVPEEASRKRRVILDIVNELIEERRRKHTATNDNEQHQNGLPVGNIENDCGPESGIPLVSEAGTSGRICHADSSFSIAGLRIENELRVSNAGSFIEAEYRTDSFQQLNGIASPLQ